MHSISILEELSHHSTPEHLATRNRKMMDAADRGRSSVSGLRLGGIGFVAVGTHRPVPNQVFVSPNEGIAYSGDVGFIQFVHSLTSTL
jgi:hypothetical protein